jgi:endonuclease YncB( thermonuclease family)
MMPSPDEIARFSPYDKHSPQWTLSGLDTLARVVSIYDGDTLMAVVPCAGGFFRFSVRLDGIDTCEMNSAAAANRNIARLARDRLGQMITNTDFGWDDVLERDVCLVRLKCGGFDKYGRLLASVFSAGTQKKSYNDVLVEERLAYVYNGGTKLAEEEQMRVLGRQIPK